VILDLSRPPEVHALGRAFEVDPVRFDHRAVDDHVGVAGGPRREKRIAQFRGLRGQHVDALVQVPVARRGGDVVVVAEVRDPDAVTVPAQQEHGLLPRSEGAGPGPGSPALPFRGQQIGHSSHSVFGELQFAVVWDTHARAGPRLKSIFGRTYFLPGPRVLRLGDPAPVTFRDGHGVWRGVAGKGSLTDGLDFGTKKLPASTRVATDIFHGPVWQPKAAQPTDWKTHRNGGRLAPTGALGRWWVWGRGFGCGLTRKLNVTGAGSRPPGHLAAGA
jgi:hypothetical protein